MENTNTPCDHMPGNKDGINVLIDRIREDSKMLGGIIILEKLNPDLLSGKDIYAEKMAIIDRIQNSIGQLTLNIVPFIGIKQGQ